MADLTFTLPWPARPLWPNARPHWAQKAKHARYAKQLAFIEARNASRAQRVNAHSVKLSYTFCPPSTRAYDKDNALSAMKASTDGIRDALGIDDSMYDFEIIKGDKRKGGAVEVRITLEEVP